MGEVLIFEAEGVAESPVHRGSVFYGPCPTWLAGRDRDGKFPAGETVRIAGTDYTVHAIERHLPATPYREGEPIGLLVNEPS